MSVMYGWTHEAGTQSYTILPSPGAKHFLQAPTRKEAMKLRSEAVKVVRQQGLKGRIALLRLKDMNTVTFSYTVVCVYPSTIIYEEETHA